MIEQHIDVTPDSPLYRQKMMQAAREQKAAEIQAQAEQAKIQAEVDRYEYFHDPRVLMEIYNRTVDKLVVFFQEASAQGGVEKVVQTMAMENGYSFSDTPAGYTWRVLVKAAQDSMYIYSIGGRIKPEESIVPWIYVPWNKKTIGVFARTQLGIPVEFSDEGADHKDGDLAGVILLNALYDEKILALLPDNSVATEIQAVIDCDDTGYSQRHLLNLLMLTARWRPETARYGDEVTIFFPFSINPLAYALTAWSVEHFDTLVQAPNLIEGMMIAQKLFGFLNESDPKAVRRQMLLDYWSNYDHTDTPIHLGGYALQASRLYEERYFRNKESWHLRELKQLPTYIHQYETARRKQSQFVPATLSKVGQVPDRFFDPGDSFTRSQAQSLRQSLIDEAQLEEHMMADTVHRSKTKVEKAFAQTGKYYLSDTELRSSFLERSPRKGQTLEDDDATDTDLFINIDNSKRIEAWAKGNIYTVFEIVERALVAYKKGDDDGSSTTSKLPPIYSLVKDIFYGFKAQRGWWRAVGDHHVLPGLEKVFYIINFAYYHSFNQGFDGPTLKRIGEIYEEAIALLQPEINNLKDIVVVPQPISSLDNLGGGVQFSWDSYEEAQDRAIETTEELTFDDGLVPIHNPTLEAHFEERLQAFLSATSAYTSILEHAELPKMIAALANGEKINLYKEHTPEIGIWQSAVGIIYLLAVFGVSTWIFEHGPSSWSDDELILGLISMVFSWGAFLKMNAEMAQTIKRNWTAAVTSQEILNPNRYELNIQRNSAADINDFVSNFLSNPSTRDKINLADKVSRENARFFLYLMLFLTAVVMVMSFGLTTVLGEVEDSESGASETTKVAFGFEPDHAPGSQLNVVENDRDGVEKSMVPSIYLDGSGQHSGFAGRQLCWPRPGENNVQYYCGSAQEIAMFGWQMKDNQIFYMNGGQDLQANIDAMQKDPTLEIQRKAPGSTYFEILMGFEPIAVWVVNGHGVQATVNPFMGIMVNGEFEEIIVIHRALPNPNRLPTPATPLSPGYYDVIPDWDIAGLEQIKPLLDDVTDMYRQQQVAIQQSHPSELAYQAKLPPSQRNWSTNVEIAYYISQWFYANGWEYGFEDFKATDYSNASESFVEQLKRRFWDCQQITRARSNIMRGAAKQAGGEAYGQGTVYEMVGYALPGMGGWQAWDNSMHQVLLIREVTGELILMPDTLPSRNGVEFPHAIPPDSYDAGVAQYAGSADDDSDRIVQFLYDNRGKSALVSGLLLALLAGQQYRRRRQRMKQAYKQKKGLVVTEGLPEMADTEDDTSDSSGAGAIPLLGGDDIPAVFLEGLDTNNGVESGGGGEANLSSLSRADLLPLKSFYEAIALQRTDYIDQLAGEIAHQDRDTFSNVGLLVGLIVDMFAHPDAIFPPNKEGLFADYEQAIEGFVRSFMQLERQLAQRQFPPSSENPMERSQLDSSQKRFRNHLARALLGQKTVVPDVHVPDIIAAFELDIHQLDQIERFDFDNLLTAFALAKQLLLEEQADLGLEQFTYSTAIHEQVGVTLIDSQELAAALSLDRDEEIKARINRGILAAVEFIEYFEELVKESR